MFVLTVIECISNMQGAGAWKSVIFVYFFNFYLDQNCGGVTYISIEIHPYTWSQTVHTSNMLQPLKLSVFWRLFLEN